MLHNKFVLLFFGCFKQLLESDVLLTPVQHNIKYYIKIIQTMNNI